MSSMRAQLPTRMALPDVHAAENLAHNDPIDTRCS